MHRGGPLARTALLTSAASIAALLMALALSNGPALADGGTGGGPGGAGGTDSATGTGGTGGNGVTLNSGGGGGGAGAPGSGGMGGNGAADSSANPGGAGGAGGTGVTLDGSSGNPGTGGNAGGGGGGGGANGFVGAMLPTSDAFGGLGGDGGAGAGSGNGGGGGAGGFGAVVTGGGNLGTLNATVGGFQGGAGGAGSIGGNGGSGGTGLLLTGVGTTLTVGVGELVSGGFGGNGGDGTAANGNGGNGGTALVVADPGGATLTIFGAVFGGNSGPAGAGAGSPGTSGIGGAGIVGQNLAITIGAGGFVAGANGADAITFTGGANTLSFGDSSPLLNGNIGVTGSLTFDQSGTNATLSNVITGSGSVTMNGNATITLSGANTYTGGTTVLAGTLAVAGAGTLGNTANNLTVNGATAVLDLGGTTQTQNGGMSLQNGGTIQNGTLNSSGGFDMQSGSVSAALGGTGFVTKDTAGTVTFSGANTYSGGTLIEAGTLALTGKGTLGTPGGLTQVLAGVLDLGGTTQTQNGGVHLGGGTIQNGTLSSSGTFLLASGSVSANLTGSGNVLKVTTDTVILTGANSYGVTSIAAGILQVGNGAAAGTLGTGGVTDNATLSFNRSDAVTVANAVSGTGGLSQIGTGTLVLTGANNYSGTTTISAGVLQIGNGGTFGTLGTGSVLDNATLVFNRSDAVTVANNISGAGVVDFNGSGTTTLSGTSTYAGTTNVNAGALAVTGSVTSSVNVANGALLSGTGAVGGTTIANGATLAPGRNGFGTLMVNGSLTLASASLYLVGVNATSSGSTHVIGTATVGGTVVAAFQGTSFQHKYAIVTANSVSGQFGTLLTNLPNLFSVNLVDTSTEVDLVVSSSAANLSGLSANQAAVGTGLANAFNFGGGLLAGLANLTPSQFAAALNALSGEGLSGVQESGLGAGGMVLDTLQQQALDGLGNGGSANALAGKALGYAAEDTDADQATDSTLGYAAKNRPKDVPAVLKAMPLKAPVFEPRWRGWAAGFGGTARLDGEGDVGSADLTHSTAGGMAGIDHLVAPNVLLGAAVGGSASNFSVGDRATSGSLDGVHAGLYAATRQGGWYATAAATFASFNNKTTRTIAGVGPTEIANASFDSNLWGGRIETGFRNTLGTFAVTPFAAVQPTTLHIAGFTESSTTLGGAPGVLGLTVAAHNVDSLPTFVGVQLENSLTVASGWTWSPYGRVAWVHEFKPDRDLTATFITLPAAGFTVFGPRAARDAVRLDVGSKLQISRNVYLFDSFDGEFGQRSQTYSGKGGVTIAW